MKSKTYITKSANQTRKIGEKMAKEIVSPTTTLNRGERWGRGLSTKKNGAIVLAMQGDLGGGKTTFIQGFARGLGIKENITSPTFVILKKFAIPKFQFFYHIDCYRLEKPEDLIELGINNILSDRNNIVAIEWSEKVQKILPKNVIQIKFGFVDENTRKIVIK
jgi:tRNA threonylcarbamoyladenosine biosynthesis protein TsaE